jgi:hypothetical protein
MLNRRQRRAIERTEKKTHKLEPQACVLWVPSRNGYARDFGPQGFRVVEQADLAQRFCDDRASSAALTFRALFGVAAVVRRYVSRASAAGAARLSPPAEAAL